MKRVKSLFFLCSLLLVMSGCGKKGDPSKPIVPQPLPANTVSARIAENGVVLSWSPPAAYDTEKALELDDIKYFRIYRKIEPPVENGWNFKQSAEGWTTTGESLPPRPYKGVLRATSDQRLLTLLSPTDLNLGADQNRIIHLKLWAKNARQGYLTFITTADTRWDRDITQEFEPSVHSSFYAVHQAFNSSKLKRFPVRRSTSATAQNYIIDMRSIPAWTGTIQQIGLILENSSPEDAQVELGLESVKFLPDIDTPATIYHTAPWVFFDDEEGWRIFPGDHPFGVGQGVLHTEGNALLSLLSAPGQHIPFNEASTLQVRMRVTAGDEAYLILRRKGEKLFQSEKELTNAVSRSIRIPLKISSDFSTYTIDLSQYIEELASFDDGAQDPPSEKEQQPLSAALAPETSADPKEETSPDQLDETTEATSPSKYVKKPSAFAQIGLVFPAVESRNAIRQISIDYIDILPEEANPAENNRQLAQLAIPSEREISQGISTETQEKRSAFILPFDSLPEPEEQSAADRILLTEIVPSEAESAEFSNGSFKLIDSGEFITENDDGEEVAATLEYGNRYTYEVEVTDRKKRASELSEAISIEFMQAPTAPRNITAEGDDGKITLSWDRPILTQDGKKIQNLAGYRIFRSTDDEKNSELAFAELPASQTQDNEKRSESAFAELPASQTQFVDSSVTNRKTYYYTIQAVASQLSGTQGGTLSAEVSAMPLDVTAPDVPLGLVGVFLDDKVQLHWNQVPTADFAGFNVYRSDSRDGEFRKLNDELLRSASFSDEHVEARKRYYYYVTALDDETPPNESYPSELERVETYPLD